MPVAPDLSAMVPVRLAGIPFDQAFLDGRPHHGYATATVAEAYVNAVKYFGMDGWYLYGSLPEICPEDRPHWDVTWEPRREGRADAPLLCTDAVRRAVAGQDLSAGPAAVGGGEAAQGAQARLAAAAGA